MNIIEERRRKAWAHATTVIMNKVIGEASTGILFIYGEALHGKDYFITPDDALDAVLDTMGILSDVTRSPFFAFDMKGECREVEHQTRIHVPEGSWGEYQFNVN